MDIQTLADSPRNERGGGQVSRLLLTARQFGSRQLSVTWVECQPGSQQALHAHPAHEQVYVIVEGRGQMLVGAEACEGGSVRGWPGHAGVRAVGHPACDPAPLAASAWCMCRRPHRRLRPPSPARHGRSRT